MQDLVTYCGDTVRVCGRPFRHSGAVPQPASTRATARRSIDLRAPGHGRVHNVRTYTSGNDYASIVHAELRLQTDRHAICDDAIGNVAARLHARIPAHSRILARLKSAVAAHDGTPVSDSRQRVFDTGEITTEGTPPSVALAVTVAPSNYHGASSVAPPETGGGRAGSACR